MIIALKTFALIWCALQAKSIAVIAINTLSLDRVRNIWQVTLSAHDRIRLLITVLALSCLWIKESARLAQVTSFWTTEPTIFATFDYAVRAHSIEQ